MAKAKGRYQLRSMRTSVGEGLLVVTVEVLTAQVKELAKNLGADLVGVAQAESFAGAPAGHRPGDLLRGARSVVTVAIHLPNAALETAPSREYSMSYMVANRELDRIAFRMARFLEAQGYRALHVPASPPYDLARNMGDLSHRHAGYLAGLGVFGKSSLLLSPEFGPRMRLVSVITEAPLLSNTPLELDLCGECEECLRACPPQALKGERIVDKGQCDAHHLEVGERLQLQSWEQICGVCLRVCPVGKSARPNAAA